MSIKVTISTIMFKIFSSIAFVSFLILICVADVPSGQEYKLISFLAVFVTSLILSILLADKHIILRHLFAFSMVISLFFGLIFKKTDEFHQKLYDIAFSENSVFEFYKYMLNIYSVN